MSKSGLVDIECKICLDDPKKEAIAVADGTEELYQGKKHEKWFWLPRQYVEVNNDGTVTIPEWLAIQKGLV